MSPWFRFTSVDNVEQSSSPTWKPLRVVARAMCCPVGHNADAATAALNARMNHFRETEFVAPGGVALNGSSLYEVPVWGAERLKHMLRTILDEIRLNSSSIPNSDIGVVIMVAEPERPGLSGDLITDALSQAFDSAQVDSGKYHGTVQMIACGRGGIGRALETCAALLDGERAPPYVLLCAVDSLLNAGAIQHFLAQERLLTSDNADGFIPGEAAAGVLLSRAPGTSIGVWIDGLGTADEEWRLDAELPMRADGLTKAIRHGVDSAGCRVVELDFHASGMTGEGWYAKEASLALSRCVEQRKPVFPHLMVARSVGETGAASPVLTLAWVAGTMIRTANGPGRGALLHFAGDDSKRAALVVRARS